VVLRGPRPTGDTSALTRELRDWVGEQLGAIAKPDDIRYADNLPKTRSGKIMRRLLRAVANDEEVTQDVSTLENPAILEQLRGTDKGATGAPAKPPAQAAKPAARPKAGSRPKAAARRPKAVASRSKRKKATRTRRTKASKPRKASRGKGSQRTATREKAGKTRSARRRTGRRR
jgi:hypothetical protein